jgi:creatinine amidohydrolase
LYAIESGVTRWADLAWPEVRDAVSPAEGHAVGLVPVGATEQHGPHLPVGTDTLVAQAICDEASARTGCLVLPALPVAVSYGHGTDLPGTLCLTPELMAAVLRQYALWAAMSGLTRLLFVNAHLGNTATIGIATDALRLHHPELRVGTVDWWACDPQVTAEATADGEDIHANRAETSLVMAIAPELVRVERVADADDEDRTEGLVFRYTAPALSRNGVTGRPSQASAALGHTLLARIANSVASRVIRGQTEEPPLGVATAPSYLA